MSEDTRIILKTGEPRNEYIRRRIRDGAPTSVIVKEINEPELYSGIPGSRWQAAVVHSERRVMGSTNSDALGEVPAFLQTSEEAAEDEAEVVETVPPEYEDILTPEDVAEIKKEAAAGIAAKIKKQARADLLKKAAAELEREAREAQKRGAAKGDMVDVHIDLAPYAPYIRLDGEVYWHGIMYRVPRPVANTLAEQMQWTWRQQENISGQRNDFNRQRSISLSGKKGATGTEGLRV